MKRAQRLFGLDQKRLRSRRLIWLAIFSPLLVISLLLGTRFIGMEVIAAYSNYAYEQGNLEAAQKRIELLRPFNLFEPYLVPYNIGTAKLKAGNLDAGIADLRDAKKSWESSYDINKPKYAECKIANNLAYGLLLKSRSLDAGDKEGKLKLLEEAQELLKPCLSGGGASEGNQNSKETGATGKEVEKDTKEAKGNDQSEDKPKDGAQNDDGQAPPPSTDERHSSKDGEGKEVQTPERSPAEKRKEEQLQEKNRGSDDPDQQQTDGESDGGTDKPW